MENDETTGIEHKKPRNMIYILTVGDGDLTLSLALARAYGSHRHDQISLTASTILSNENDLVRLYPNANQVLEELRQRGVPVLFGVDATQLHASELFANHGQKFDLILFYHPHLGIQTNKINPDGDADAEETMKARRHECLLAHYLASAATCLQSKGTVHLCLCGKQPETWKVRETIQRLGLRQIATGKSTTAAPWHEVMNLPLLQATDPQTDPSWAAPRKYRNGKHGSRHWLGKYGYRHRRTQGELYDGSSSDTNVEWSVDLLFQPTENLISPWSKPHCSITDNNFVCPLCLEPSDSLVHHERHMNAPSTPRDVELVADVQLSQEQACATESNNMNKHAMSENDKTDEKSQGVRLRRYVQKHFRQTKSAASKSILAGLVSVDGQVVKDCACFVFENSVVELKHEKDAIGDNDNMQRVQSANSRIEIIAQVKDQCFWVVWKPVGLRTKGQFTGTLEELVARQEGVDGALESLTRLDTGISGLCVLYNPNGAIPEYRSFCHRFTSLVIGNVTVLGNGDLDITLQSNNHRRWGKESAVDTDRAGDETAYKAVLRVIETCPIPARSADGENNELELTLSTIELDVFETSPGIGSLISQTLRKHFDLRVIGDRFSNKEYVNLPRPMRNRLKQKICLGCTLISYQGQKWDYPVPDKWKADFWKQFLRSTKNQNADAVALDAIPQQLDSC